MTNYAIPLLAAATTILMGVGPAAGADHRIECPTEIPRSSIAITRVPAGWTAFVPFEFQPGLPLVSAGLMWGPPSTMTISKPSFVGKLHGQDIEKWTQLREMTGSEKWMACFYGEDGRHDAILSKRIDDNATECSVTYATEKRRTILNIRCKW
ncbi:hypothetical protein FHW58_003766 [Duganella sp. 1224]|uniref:STY0301 family protein n=1 Tax=Duganella sp. 1224 TaxID=2587052 RepID=UPI0015C7CAB3|nr:STY0301 family protein [Duganella sp. 1224]NYE62547.1 hypothetical protein [Duganella sp. 1224]